MPPVLIHNDEPGWAPEQFSQFDNIVLSPGPGRPDREDDFGLCASAIKQGIVPVLGICLGHQGICHSHGGQTVFAKEARHGRLSQVFHDGKGLFKDIPVPFEAVRYHSLMVEGLPDAIEVVARSDDGAVMGVRHKILPQWGVQFHPESICTAYGRQLFVNFRQLTESWWRDRRPLRSDVFSQTVPVMPQDNSPVQQGASWKLLYRRIPGKGIPWDTEQLFNDLFRKTGPAVWLDSNRMGYGTGRFSFLGAPSGAYGRIAVADVSEGAVTIKGQDGRKEKYWKDCLDWLSEDIRRHPVSVPDLPFEFALGWMGYLGYELKAQCGAENACRSPYPDAGLLFCDRGMVVDHQENTLYLLALVPDEDDGAADRWLAQALQRVKASADAGLSHEPLPDPFLLAGPLALLHDRETYIAKIKVCQELIRQGETYEVCLTNTVHGKADADPWTVYRMLRRRNPAPYSAFMQFEGISILSCSPEQFLKITRSGTAVSKPIKGTRPRSADDALDARIRQELAENEKERAENLMIVDLVRHDLGWTAEIGSVRVPELFAVESYETVHQLVSTITSKIRQDSSPCQCIRYAFPGGSMTGAPKKRTMEILDRLEGTARGIYSGALGYFSLCGAVDLSIVIRTLVMHEDGSFSFGVGGAITALSDPDEEFEETRVKAKAFLDLFNTDFPDA